MGANATQRVFVSLGLRFEDIVRRPLISGKGTQLCLRASGTRAQELGKKLEDAYISVDSGTHPPTLREVRVP